MVTFEVSNRVKKNIRDYNMFSAGDTVVIGVSGGADSVMLLNVMSSMEKIFDITIKVAHVNHGIRKGTAERDAEFVKSLCQKYGYEFYLKEVDVPSLSKELGVSEETAGRIVRYQFFEEVANGGKIAVAHNANDNVETVFMHFMRGCGLNGLTGISFKRGNIVRPILNVTREEIEEYLKENCLAHITDETNFEMDYNRNKVRLDLIPKIQNNFNPNIVDTVNQNVLSFNEDNDFIALETERVFVKYARNEDNKWFFDKEVLKNLHPAIAKRVIIKLIQLTEGKIQDCTPPKKIQEIFNGLGCKVGTTFILSDYYRVRISYKEIIVERYNLEENNKIEEVLNKRLEVGEFSFLDKTFKCEIVNEALIDNQGSVIYIPYDKYKDTVFTFRTRRTGDIFRINDEMSKKLNHYMSTNKIPLEIRDNVILMVSDKVLWIVGNKATRFRNRSGKFFKITIQ